MRSNDISGPCYFLRLYSCFSVNFYTYFCVCRHIFTVYTFHLYLLGWIKLCCDCDQYTYSGHVSSVLSHHWLVVINVRRTPLECVFIFLFAKVCQAMGSCWKNFKFFSVKCQKFTSTWRWMLKAHIRQMMEDGSFHVLRAH